MEDAENGNAKEPASTHATDSEIHEKERPRPFESGPQPLRPAAPLRIIPRPQKPIPRPEPQPRFGRTRNALKAALPLLQKALPLLEGNVASTVANFLTPLAQNAQADLEPIHHGLATLHAEQEALRGKVTEQATALRRMDEQLHDLDDAASRQAAAQQELADDLGALRRRVTVLALAGFGLLAVSIALNIFLLVRTGYGLR